ncbi:MAG: hypothetical protein WDA75_20485 [Candidatus Latescibacterota bacterium]|jgi:hypothetical protein
MISIEPERVARVARLYPSNQEAARALGIAEQSFGRLCRRLGIQTPYARQAHRHGPKGRPGGNPSTDGEGT